jgi:hypothetical protein
MQWFTIGPESLDKLRSTTLRIRGRLGTRDLASRVRALPEAELGELLNDVLALVDESEAILARVRSETPTRALPRPFDKK